MKLNERLYSVSYSAKIYNEDGWAYKVYIDEGGNVAIRRSVDKESTWKIPASFSSEDLEQVYKAAEVIYQNSREA